MRVCPKCGYTDPPYWRHSKFSSWIDLCEYEDFKEMHPDLAQRLEDGEQNVEDKDYVYRRTKNLKRVHRKAKVDFMGSWVVDQEKAKHQIIDTRPYWIWNPNQRRLLDSSESSEEEEPEK